MKTKNNYFSKQNTQKELTATINDNDKEEYWKAICIGEQYEEYEK